MIRFVKLLIFVFPIMAMADADTKTEEEKELEQVMQLLKNSGMDPESAKQFEKMMQGQADGVTEQQAKSMQSRKEAFDKKHGAEKSAVLVVNGDTYELTVTACEWTNRDHGSFGVIAESKPGEEKVTVNVVGGGRYSPNTLNFQTPKHSNDPQPTDFSFDGERFEWGGIVGGNGFDGPSLSVSFKAECQ